MIIWAKATFFFEQLFPVVARTWLESRSGFFLGPKSLFLVQKSDFCHTTPILVNDPFLVLTMTVNFPPWEQFFDFPFRSYSCFRKKFGWPVKKSFPFPLWGHRLPVTALALSARTPFGPARIIWEGCSVADIWNIWKNLESFTNKFQRWDIFQSILISC